MKRITIASVIMCAVIMAGCGGAVTKQPDSPATLPLSAYYPMTPGTHQAYTVTSISAAHWDSQTHEVVIDGRDPAPNPLGTFLVQRYATATCAALDRSKPLPAYEWNFQNTTTPRTGPLDWKQLLGDMQATSTNGIPYIGEAFGLNSSGTPPEPLITMQPVAGEEIHQVAIITRGCNDASVLETDFGEDYYTVRHLDTWNGYSDLWQTSLVERHAGGIAPIYYSYFFARGIGMVGLSCWTDAPDHFSCGNEYIGVSK